MMNELVLLGHIIFISCMAIISLRISKEALVAFTVITIMLANLFVLQQTTLFSLQATSADALAVGSMLGFNLLQEFYDRRLAKQTIIITFIMLAMYVGLAHFHLLYTPSLIDHSYDHFKALLSITPWLVGGSIISWILAQCIDFIIFGILQRIWAERLLIVRNYIAIGLSQALDTFLFTQLLFWLGIISNVMQVFIISFAIKFIITLIATPLVALFVQSHNVNK
jgi:uncharacterized integral membrane protein (TIGR00697 family)